jgi:hypothetical protein
VWGEVNEAVPGVFEGEPGQPLQLSVVEHDGVLLVLPPEVLDQGALGIFGQLHFQLFLHDFEEVMI